MLGVRNVGTKGWLYTLSYEALGSVAKIKMFVLWLKAPNCLSISRVLLMRPCPDLLELSSKLKFPSY